MKSCIMPAMLKAGMTLIVGDQDLEEEYVADCMKNENKYNPIVQIRFVLRYPMQHAIVWPDVPNENRPVDEGVICRLPFIRFATLEEINRFSSYTDSLKAAQEVRLFQARGEGDSSTAEIILRHMRGEYKGKRVVISYRRWEI